MFAKKSRKVISSCVYAISVTHIHQKVGSTCYIKKGLKTKTSCFYSYILCYSVNGYSLFIYLFIYLSIVDNITIKN